MFGAIGLWLGKKLIFQRLGGILKRVPAKVWIALAIIAAIGGAYWLHQHVASARLQARYDAGYAQGRLDAVKAQLAAQRAANAASTAINSKLKEKNDAETRAIGRDADDLRLRGPGRATCPGVAAPRAAPGGRVDASGPGHAAVGQVPDPARPDLIALPFSILIDFAEQHDKLRSEALTWRESDRQQRELAEKSQPKE